MRGRRRFPDEGSSIVLKWRSLIAARFLLPLRPMKSLALLLAMLLASVAPAAADPRTDTDAALTELRTAEAALKSATASRTALGTRYEGELRTIDRLKKQRGSWRRDRELRDSLATSLETAKKLEAATAAQQRAQARRDKAKQRSLGAVDAELALTATEAARRQALTQERAKLAPATRVAAPAKKIILPDLAIDPLADPEELEQQAAAIRESEEALSAQVASLDQRAGRLAKAVDLRRQHARAEDLSEREEGQTRRGTFRSGRAEETNDSDGGSGPGAGGSPDGAPPNPTPDPPSEPTDRGLQPTLEDRIALAESSTVLGDVIDASSLESLRKAQASTDPAVRAAAAKKARDAAAAKLAELRKRRAAIEARARGLRGPAK